MTSGVLYHFTGISSVIPLICAIHQLRKYWGGPVCVATVPELISIVERIGDDLDCQHVTTYCMPRCVHTHWIAKAFTYMLSPFDRTLYMDADTIVQTDCVQDFFRGDAFTVVRVNEFGLAATNRYGDYGRQQLQWVPKYGEVFQRLYDDAIEQDVPLINAGVIAFCKRDPMVQRTHDLTLAIRKSRASDEHVIQLLMTCMPHEIFAPPYNWLPDRYAAGHSSERKVYHFFRKMWRKDYKAEFTPYVMEAKEKNIGGIMDYADSEEGRALSL